MAKRRVTQKELRNLQGWERFLEVELGAYPATMASIMLGTTTSAVFNASERGKLVFFQIGRNRWYGRKSLIIYRDEVSEKHKNVRKYTPRRKNFSADFEQKNPAADMEDIRVWTGN
ncbi:MAG: hypothetical protein ABIT37_10595 [Luteolibacter sp.]